MSKSYDSKDIVVLEGLDAVRLRPGMYIGTTGIKGFHHLLWEIVDNAVDEVSNGYGNKINVTLHSDGSASVVDNGRGIPTDKHPKLGISGVEVVFTQLHAGGKFESDNYQFSGGLHGVGASVTNALSVWTEVYVDRDGKRYYTRFESVEDKKTKHIKSGICVEPLKVIGESKTTGTLVRFLPDSRVFGNVSFDYNTIATKLKEIAFLNKGIEINFIDDRKNDGRPLVRQYKFNGGIADYVKYLNNAKTVLYEKPLYLEGKSDRIQLECAIQHTNEYIDTVYSYVNNIPTTDGGTHETGLRSALTKVFNDTARKLNLLKDKESNLQGDDFREGLTCVLTVKMRNVQFEGQTKTKLGNPEIKQEVETIVTEQLSRLLLKNDNKKSFEAIIEKAKGAAKVREAAKRAKELTRQQNKADNINLVGKLANCSGKKPELNELFIVEGDSAGGSAKQGRDRFFQAILPLRGKPLNVEKKRLEQVLQNDEIKMIISALGTGIGDNFDIDDLRFYKTIILADADQDGEHIKSILLTFFYRYMKGLITNGNIYIGVPPLYKLQKKDQIIYAYTDADLDEKKAKLGKGYEIQRYKGLGEMNPEQLWETTLNPKNRLLIRVTIDDAAEAERMITTLMGDNVEERKNYIAEYADFNRVDTFNSKES